MLDYRFHYAIMQAEDRLRAARRPELTLDRGIRRVYRLSAERAEGRKAGLR
jgi:hypothetical protein